jgi:hypothetical protein
MTNYSEEMRTSIALSLAGHNPGKHPVIARLFLAFNSSQSRLAAKAARHGMQA